jgi:DNA-binding HxlR family transcriptional regulator
MAGYGQFCPIARASEVLAERWTPIIVRNLLLGCRTFNDIADGAPGLSRSLLSKRLRELERAGIILIRPKPTGRGSIYELTRAGRDLWPVIGSLREWGARWVELAPHHVDPGMVLWAWATSCLERDRLPEARVVVRFEAPSQPPSRRRGGSSSRTATSRCAPRTRGSTRTFSSWSRTTRSWCAGTSAS